MIRENNIRFREEIRVGEDALFNLDYGRYCKKVYYFQLGVYYYNLCNNSSVMHKYKFEYVDDYIFLFESFQKMLDIYSDLRIEVDEDYYLSQLYRCLYNKWPKIDNETKKRIKQSYFYTIITKKRYNSLKSMIKRALISIALLDSRIIHPSNKD